jgi:transcriptional regulator with PAS, ATPase and Fis domain
MSRRVGARSIVASIPLETGVAQASPGSDGRLEQLTPGIVAESAAMADALAAARQVAATDATVLLLGESGTGKSHLARFIHFNSQRAQGPLVEVHCAALAEGLLESELFGHERGAFTGASERTHGHLQASEGGSLFLDEVGEISLVNQVKLLRFLQGRELVPVGSTQPRKIDARVIAATNRDLGAAVRSGALREDFYYRVNVFSIYLPALRERREEIVPLAERFLSLQGVPVEKLSRRAREEMLRRPWPGNVRELENALERALILAGEDDIRAEHLGQPGLLLGGSSFDAGSVLCKGFKLDRFERDLVYAALERAGGNKAAAARLLGITRRRLYSMLQRFADLKTAEPGRSE